MTSSPSADVERPLRAYLAALLPPDAIEAAVAEVSDHVRPDDDPATVFAAAHEVVSQRARVATDVEAEVLVHEAGLTIPETARALGVEPDAVEDALATAEAVADELDVPLPSPSRPRVLVFDDTDDGPLPVVEVSEPRERSSRLTIAVLLLVGIALAAALLLPRGGSAPPNGSLQVTDARVTSGVDLGGRPEPAKNRFRAGEDVAFWFTYRLPASEAVPVTLVVHRDGEELQPASTVLLAPGEHDLHLVVPRSLVDEPATYRIELSRGGQVLVAREFAVSAG